MRRLHIHERVMLAGSAILLAASTMATIVTSDWWVKLESLHVQVSWKVADTTVIYTRSHTLSRHDALPILAKLAT